MMMKTYVDLFVTVLIMDTGYVLYEVRTET
jgi:hypothetical protein